MSSSQREAELSREDDHVGKLLLSVDAPVLTSNKFQRKLKRRIKLTLRQDVGFDHCEAIYEYRSMIIFEPIIYLLVPSLPASPDESPHLRSHRCLIGFLRFIALLIRFLSNSMSTQRFSNCGRRLRPSSPSMPWTIWPALVVLWGVCWMFWHRPGSPIVSESGLWDDYERIGERSDQA